MRLRIQQILPVLRLLQKPRGNVLMPQRLRKLRDREIVACVLQRARRIDGILVHRNVAQLQIVRQEWPLVIVLRLASPPSPCTSARSPHRSSTRPERIRRRDHRRRRVPAHHVGHVVGSFPARKLPALLRVVHQRLVHVRRALGKKQRLPLHRVAINIPIGEVSVLRLLPRARQRVQLCRRSPCSARPHR